MNYKSEKSLCRATPRFDNYVSQEAKVCQHLVDVCKKCFTWTYVTRVFGKSLSKHVSQAISPGVT